jgi:hypothetical protein
MWQCLQVQGEETELLIYYVHSADTLQARDTWGEEIDTLITYIHSLTTSPGPLYLGEETAGDAECASDEACDNKDEDCISDD